MSVTSRPDVALGLECAWPNPYAPLPVHRRPTQSVWQRLRIGAAVILLALGAWQFGQGAWIQAKAWLAQVLISKAWAKTLAGHRNVKPWPWADTWPVARLSVPALGIERYVLAGANGAAMAFGPGHLEGTARPGDAGNSVIGGHRDTHLAFLRDLPLGAEIHLESSDGSQRRYLVRHAMVLDKRDVWVAKQEGSTRLTLITCYPFGGLRADGAQRYVISAFAEGTDHQEARTATRAPLKNRGSERAARS